MESNNDIQQRLNDLEAIRAKQTFAKYNGLPQVESLTSKIMGNENKDAVLYPDSLPDKLDGERFHSKIDYDMDEPLRFPKPRPWVKEIETYCQQQGISPQELVDFHKHFTL